MKHAVTAKIRKLLRLAQSEGHEGSVAQSRANELMEKHNIRVSLEEIVRVPVNDVAGTFWKEQLLTAVAATHHCSIIESTRGTRIMALQGDKSDVDTAVVIFDEIVRELAIACTSSWRFHIVAWSNYNREEAERMWHRLFHLAAVNEAINRLTASRAAAPEPVMPPRASGNDAANVHEAPTVAPPEEPAATPRPTTEERIVEERQKSETDLAELADMLGELESKYVHRLAWGQGQAAGAQVDIISQKFIRLAASSSVG